MDEEIARELEAPVADNTNERFQTGVFVVVLFEIDDISETFAAGVAIVREFLQMHAIHVRQKGGASLRRVTAQGTPENLVATVLVHMDREWVHASEHFVALFTFETFVVVFDVFLDLLQRAAFSVARVTTVQVQAIVVAVARFCHVVFIASMARFAVLFQQANAGELRWAFLAVPDSFFSTARPEIKPVSVLCVGKKTATYE